MNSWQRIFAFISGSIVFGLVIIVVSHNFIQYVEEPGSTGYLFLLGFGLVYLNINFAISRRFSVKAPKEVWVCYLMALFTIVPTIFWVYTRDVGLVDLELSFVGAIIFSAFLGAFFGIRRGRAKRQVYLKRIREEQEQQMPDELKRPHEDLSSN